MLRKLKPCAYYATIIAGNIAIKDSKRYGYIDDCFMPDKEWAARRESFFQRAK